MNIFIKNVWGEAMSSGPKNCKVEDLKSIKYKALLEEFRADYLRIQPNSIYEFDVRRTPGTPSSFFYRRKFSVSWVELLEAAGIEIPQPERRENKAYNQNLTDQECLVLFKNEFLRTNPKSIVEYNTFKSPNTPTVSWFLRRLGISWRDLKATAGVISPPRTRVVPGPSRTIRSLYVTDVEFEILSNLQYKFRALYPTGPDRGLKKPQIKPKPGVNQRGLQMTDAEFALTREAMRDMRRHFPKSKSS